MQRRYVNKIRGVDPSLTILMIGCSFMNLGRSEEVSVVRMEVAGQVM
jgi:hypothetical protein